MVLLLTAVLLLQSGDAEKAKALCAEGDVLGEAGNYAEALAKYEEALKHDKEKRNALYNAGLMSYLTEKFERAAGHWERLVALEPADLPVMAKLVQAWQGAGKTEKRDAARKKLLEARVKATEEEKAKRTTFCRDQFKVGATRVMAFETFEMKGARMVRYRFSVLDDKGKEAYWISLGSYDITTELAREQGSIGKDERMWHLDRYSDGGSAHGLLGMYKKEPTYDETRKLVEEALKKGQKK